MTKHQPKCEVEKKYGICRVSTGICERITFGGGELDDYGYWEFPCDECARRWEKEHPEYGEAWPPRKKDAEDK